MVTETEAAYAAGFFDGEGCIMISRRKNTFWIRFEIAQADPAPLHWLAARWCGKVRRYHSRARPIWYWGLSSISAMRFLHAIRPFLIVKAGQVDIAFEFEKTVALKLVGRPTPPGVLAARTKLVARMKDAKRAYLDL